MVASLTVIDASIVATLIPARNGKGKRRFIIGTRIDMADGSWWMFSRKFGTWTKHTPGLPQYHKSGSPLLGDDMKPVVGKERVESFGTSAKLHRTMGHCKALMDALTLGLAIAA